MSVGRESQIASKDQGCSRHTSRPWATWGSGADQRAQIADDAALPDLNPTEVFEACMAQHDLDDAQKVQLRISYQQVLQQVEQPEEDEA